MNNSFSTIDASLLSTISGGGELDGQIFGGPAGPSLNPNPFNPFPTLPPAPAPTPTPAPTPAPAPAPTTPVCPWMQLWG